MSLRRVLLKPNEGTTYEECVANIVKLIGTLRPMQWVVWSFASLTTEKYEDGICPVLADSSTTWSPLLTSDDLSLLFKRAVNVYDETIVLGFHEPVTRIALDINTYMHDCDAAIELVGEWTMFVTTEEQLQALLAIAPGSPVVPI